MECPTMDRCAYRARKDGLLGLCKSLQKFEQRGRKPTLSGMDGLNNCSRQDIENEQFRLIVHQLGS